jgi:membrane-associated phospholipid phosphatase
VLGADRTNRLALAVSLLLHPFVIGPVTALLLTDVRSSVVIALATTVPMLVLIARNVRRGTWTNYDVSERTHRTGLYWPGIALTGSLALILWRFGSNPGLVRAIAVITLMMAVAMVINRWLKVSLHMTFGAFFAVIVSWRYPEVTTALALALALLAWSRLTLRRHTWSEVFVGALLGCVAGAWLILM